MFRRHRRTKQFSAATKPFCALGADIRKQRFVIRPPTNAGNAGTGQRRQSMRTISFILVFALVLAGPSIAGSFRQRIPGIGTFSYSGLPVVPRYPIRSWWRQLSAPVTRQENLPVKAPHAYVSVPHHRRFVHAGGLRSSPGAIADSAVPESASAASFGFHSLFKVPDPRGEFVRLCAPHMVGRWAHPEAVCGCLHDHAAATIEDPDLREALAARHQRDRRADDRDRLGAGVEAIRDRTDLHQDSQADTSMHVRAVTTN